MEWINMQDEKPPNEITVLCCDIYNYFTSIGMYIESEDEFILMYVEKIQEDTQITHWMPLPEPPKEAVE